MISKTDSFWIKFILRVAFGFFFLIAALNIFDYGRASDFGPQAFATDLSKPFTNPSSWSGGIINWAGTGIEKVIPGSRVAIKNLPYYFLYGLPFAFAILALPILLGILLRPALRFAALLLVLLGLGKYITTPTDLSTTAHDFLFALLICVGLYFLGKEKEAAQPAEEIPY